VIGIAVGDTVDLALANANRRAPRPCAVGCEKAPRVFLEMTVKRTGRVTVPPSNLEINISRQRGRATDVQTTTRVKYQSTFPNGRCSLVPPVRDFVG
jgi:hypothetical protein